MRHDNFKDTRPGEAYYFWDEKYGTFVIAKRLVRSYEIHEYATTEIERYAIEITALFKKYEEE